MRAVTSGPCRWSSFALLLLTFALAVGVVPTSAWAQAISSGNVQGTITDPQGAVVPGVKITLTDSATKSTYTATSNADGRYFLSNVPPATYDVTAAKSGFATAKIAAQAVNVATTTTVDLKMAVGEVSTTVEVQATNTELQTMNATVGNTVTGVALNSLPSIGLDVSTFATLQPGVSPEGSVAGTAVDQSTFQLDGGNNTNDMDGSMTVYTGGFAGDPTGGIAGQSGTHGSLPSGVVPTPADSVEEFKTNTTNQTADFNSSSGMQVAVVTKRGTDKWHGTAYEYYLDNNFSANTWQNNCTTLCGKSAPVPVPDWHRSWFGVAGGGSIIPKKILGGKTYFFANYQGSRWPFSRTLTKNIPGPGMLQGLLEFEGNVYNLTPAAVTYNGPSLTGNCGTGNACLQHGVTYPVGSSNALNGAPAGGAIASSLDPRSLGVNPEILAMWNKYVPTLLGSPGVDYGSGLGDGNVFGYKANEATPVSDNFGVLRLDHDFGSKWHLFGSYRYYRLTSFQGSAQNDIGGFTSGATVGTPQALSAVPQVPWFYVAGLTTNISPTTTNDFHWSFTRNWWAWNRYGDPPQLAGLGGALEPLGETSSPLAPYNVDTQNTRTRFWDGLDNMFRDDITSLHGNHLLQFGGTYQRNHDKHQRTDNGGGINYYPVYQIGGGDTSTYEATAYNIPAEILANGDDSNYAQEYDAIKGIVNIAQQAYTRSGPNLALNSPLTPANEDSVIPFYNVYFTDSWHMKPSLTLTYGLGWTLEMPPVDSQGRQIVAVDGSDQPLDAVAYLAARQRAALQGQVYDPTIGFALIGNTANAPKYPYNPFYGSFSPRFAAAWNPDFGDGFLGKHLFGGKSTVIRGGYGRIYGRLNGVDLVLVPLLGTGLIQPVQCFNPTATGGAASCTGAGTSASNAFRIGVDGLTAPLPSASATLPQPDFPGLSLCPTSLQPTAVCAAAGAGEGFDPHFRPNSTDTFTLSIQRQIGQHNTIELGYIGRLIHNEYLPLDVNAVPYMFTKGGQQFQTAYANIEKALGCATSLSACYATKNAVAKGGNPPNVAPQPFFEAALAGTGYCTGFANCTQAVVSNEFTNLIGQNVWSLWSDLDQNYPGCASAATAAGKTPTGNCTPGFNFGPTMQSSPGAGGAPVCWSFSTSADCTNPALIPPAGLQLSSGLGMNASVGYGNYNAGYVSWRMANWHGLTSQSNLTWGKALGTGAVYQAASEYTADDPFNLHTMYGLQGWDRKITFNTFLVYEPPFFTGQSGILGHLLGGWNIAPLFSTGSGSPVYCNATLGRSEAQAFGGGDGNDYFDNEQCIATGPLPSPGVYANVPGGVDPASGVKVGTSNYSGVKYNEFSNPVAFFDNVRPAILGIDNGHDGGNGMFHGLPFWNLDLSIKKNFKVTERFSATFQTVFTNVLNHDQFTDSFVDVGLPRCLGSLYSGCSGGPQISNPRNIELSLRLNF